MKKVISPDKCQMSSDSSSQNGPPSSSSRPLPPRPVSSNLLTRSAFASFTSPSLSSTSEPTPQSSHKRHRFNVERIYEFEAPQFYDFTKQSDPERGHLDEHWFDSRKRTPSSPDFHFVARTSSSTIRPKSASGKLSHKSNFSGSNGGLSFMNTPIGRGQNFTIPSSVTGLDLQSSLSMKPRGATLKKSATTENITNSILMNSDSSDPPSTIIRSVQKRYKEFGSDERKIICGFLSTPLLVIKTPSRKGFQSSNSSASPATKKDRLPRSPLQMVTTKKSSNLGLFGTEGTSLLARETSSVEESLINFKSSETNLIEETSSGLSSALSSTDCSVPNSSIFNSLNSSIDKGSSLLANSRFNSLKDHQIFEESNKARILLERERIEAQAAAQSKKIQKLKAGPTNLPIKSTKPLTVPRGFQLKTDERALLKKSHANQISVNDQVSKFNKILKPHKFVPTIPKSPLFASKLRALNANNNESSTVKDENVQNPNITNELRRKLEFKPITKTKSTNTTTTTTTTTTTNATVPKSPKLSAIHRNRSINKN